MKGPWVKVWRKVLTDEKLALVTELHGDKAFRVWMTLLLRSEDGKVLETRQLLSSLVKTKRPTLDRILETMSEVGMIEISGEGQIIIPKWNAYQECDSVKRVRRYRERYSNATETLHERDKDENVTGRRIEGRRIEEENIKNSPHTNSSDMCVENPTGPQGQGLTRIEKARLAWNEAAAGPPMRLNVLNMGPDNRHSCMLPLPAYSDEEIAEAIDTYAKIRASSEHEVRAPYQSFVGFMRGGVEKFIAAADPWAAYKRQRGNSYRDIEERDREAALAMLGGGK